MDQDQERSLYRNWILENLKRSPTDFFEHFGFRKKHNAHHTYSATLSALSRDGNLSSEEKDCVKSLVECWNVS